MKFVNISFAKLAHSYDHFSKTSFAKEMLGL
jgi:hypothetical protein